MCVCVCVCVVWKGVAGRALDTDVNKDEGKMSTGGIAQHTHAHTDKHRHTHAHTDRQPSVQSMISNCYKTDNTERAG